MNKFIALSDFQSWGAGGAIVARKGDILELNECNVKHLLAGGFIDFYVEKKIAKKENITKELEEE